MKYLTMTQKEVNRYTIIKKLINKEINGTHAADLLNLSVRHTKRLKAKTKKHGSKGLIHANRGRISNHSIPEQEKKRIIKLLHKHYPDFKPGFASEKLANKHNIKRDPKTIRQIMIEQELWESKQNMTFLFPVDKLLRILDRFKKFCYIEKRGYLLNSTPKCNTRV